jgi:leader peptidase (prepilin peptidase) / N-methyltransferase
VFLVPGLVSAAVGAAAGAFVPRLIARVPEPAPEPVAEPVREDMQAAPDEADFARPLDEPKEPYAEVAALPGLAWKAALATAVLLGAVGARIGWHPVLLVFCYLVPVCVALTVIDWRTRLLPTWLIAPSYVVVGLLCVLASLLTGDWAALTTAVIGWLSSFAVFFVLWFVYPKGMGYGDVRLSGLLGMALGWLGLGPLILGMYAGFVIGALGGYLLSVLRVFHRRHFPFGPFMAFGAWLGVVFTAQLATGFAWLVQAFASLVSAVAGLLG